MFDDVVNFVRTLYGQKGNIPLHSPIFIGNEKKYLEQCIDSTFVSSAGKFVDQLELKIAKYTGANYAIATSSGTSALHISLLMSGVCKEDEVITQPLTFIATCNAISYCGAKPIFIDVDKDTLGLSPSALKSFLEKNTIVKDQKCINKNTGNIIKACIPMHTFGHSCRISEILEICSKYNIILIEDAAESLGSFYKGQHTGTFGSLGALSFNGNKTITTGGGGAIITNNSRLALHAKHLITTAKVPHAWSFNHDEIGYNYRMPNINAALGCAQLEQLDDKIKAKRAMFHSYKDAFSNIRGIKLISEPKNCKSNYWLQTLIIDADKLEYRDLILEATNERGLMTRPAWTLMHELKPFKDFPRMNLDVAKSLSLRLINIPSSV